MGSRNHETWKPVEGFEGLYEVSDLGRVRSLDRQDRLGREHEGVILHPSPDSAGRPTARLYREGRLSRIKVQRLVLEAFVGPRPAGREACHRNDDRADNRSVNLYWGTRRQNLLDRVANGRDHNSRKIVCPRGHLLEHPNLYRASTPGGGRSCKSCSLALRKANYHNRPFDEEEANRYYEKFMHEKEAQS